MSNCINKKKRYMFLVLGLGVILLGTSCKPSYAPAGISEISESVVTGNIKDNSSEVESKNVYMTGTVVSINVDASKQIVLASDDVYVINVEGAAVTLNGKSVDITELKQGMKVEIEYDGAVQETWPGQIANVISITSYGYADDGRVHNICGLYIRVLEDLWNSDTGLNSSVKHISIDLSNAPGNLTESEKRAIAWIFAGKHNMEPLMLSYGELVNEGYIKNGEGWEDGVILSINKSDNDSDEFSFKANKYRGPLAAIFWEDCTIQLNEDGEWENYEIGRDAIS